MAKTQVLLKIIVNLKGFFIGIYNFSLFSGFRCLQAYGVYGGGLVWFRGNTGERFRLETTFNGIKEYFHEYVQQMYFHVQRIQISMTSCYRVHMSTL